MDLSKFDLTDRTAIVTGGGRGIGKGICLALARAGANVAVAELDAVTAQSTAAEVRAMGRESLAIPTDVCSVPQVEAMVSKVVGEFGAVDILVNNAGGPMPGRRVPAMEIGEELWDALVDFNLKSAFFCSQHVARVMINQQRGSIINIASVGGCGAYPAMMPYGAAKAGVINLTQSLAALLGPNNIRVNAVAPGHIVTEGTAGMQREHHLGAIPLRRFGMPEDIAWTVVFLASDAAAYVSGQTVRVDGAVIVTTGFMDRQS